MRTKVKGLKQTARRCIDCIYYPSDCGYWEDRIRPSSRVKPETKHNCPDYKKAEGKE